MHKPISEEDFVELVGQLGVERFRRHSNGSSWLTPVGQIVSELYDGKAWNYFVSVEFN